MKDERDRPFLGVISFTYHDVRSGIRMVVLTTIKFLEKSVQSWVSRKPFFEIVPGTRT